MFNAYEHMENHYNLDKLFVLSELESNIQCVATEKIHGTNYSFLSDGSTIKPCKRNSTLTESSSFNGHQNVFNKYKSSIEHIYNIIKEKYPTVEYIQLYGELFGGLFNGQTEKNHSKVQSKTSYHMKNEFMAYDLKISILDESKSHVFYVDWLDLVELFDNNPTIIIKLVPTLKMDTLENLLKLNPVFESQVSKIYGLDEQLKPFYAEGYVIHPVRETQFISKYNNEQNHRMIFKFKNPAYLEVDQSIVTNQSTKTVKPQYSTILKKYININRYNNVSSKITMDEIDKLDDLFCQDIMLDFLSDFGEISQSDIDICQKICANLVKIFLKNINNE